MDPDALGALLTPEGQALLEELRREEEVSGGGELELQRRLRRTYPASLVLPALQLAELRRRARAKFSRADRMYFTRDGLEQATPEPVARRRASRFASFGRVADLCCGIGGDLVALGASGADTLAVDRDPLHLRMAALNADVYGVPAAELRAGDVRDADLAGVDAAFVDPARRTGGRRGLAPERSEPPLAWCLALAARVPAVAIKTAPGIPRTLAPPDWELELVSLGGELKEAVLWSPALATTSRRATLLPAAGGAAADDGRADPGGGHGDPPLRVGAMAGAYATRGLAEPGGTDGGAEAVPRSCDCGDGGSAGHTLVADPPGAEAVSCATPGAYLLDPDPAVTRAGLVEELARRLGAWKLDPEGAFLSADSAIATPFARTLRVEASLPWGLKRLREALRTLDVGSADIRKRGSPVDVDQLRRSLRLGGARRATVALTRVGGRPWALVCTDP